LPRPTGGFGTIAFAGALFSRGDGDGTAAGLDGAGAAGGAAATGAGAGSIGRGAGSGCAMAVVGVSGVRWFKSAKPAIPAAARPAMAHTATRGLLRPAGATISRVGSAAADGSVCKADGSVCKVDRSTGVVRPCACRTASSISLLV
jgi:hypothetical protein